MTHQWQRVTFIQINHSLWMDISFKIGCWKCGNRLNRLSIQFDTSIYRLCTVLQCLCITHLSHDFRKWNLIATGSTLQRLGVNSPKWLLETVCIARFISDESFFTIRFIQRFILGLQRNRWLFVLQSDRPQGVAALLAAPCLHSFRFGLRTISYSFLEHDARMEGRYTWHTAKWIRDQRCMMKHVSIFFRSMHFIALLNEEEAGRSHSKCLSCKHCDICDAGCFAMSHQCHHVPPDHSQAIKSTITILAAVSNWPCHMWWKPATGLIPCYHVDHVDHVEDIILVRWN